MVSKRGMNGYAERMNGSRVTKNTVHGLYVAIHCFFTLSENKQPISHCDHATPMARE